jgi:hypothetical protein
VGVRALGVSRPSGLMLASALGERAGVDGVEADLVDQLRDGSLSLLVSRDRNTEPLRIPGGTAVVAQRSHWIALNALTFCARPSRPTGSGARGVVITTTTPRVS